MCQTKSRDKRLRDLQNGELSYLEDKIKVEHQLDEQKRRKSRSALNQQARRRARYQRRYQEQRELLIRRERQARPTCPFLRPVPVVTHAVLLTQRQEIAPSQEFTPEVELYQAMVPIHQFFPRESRESQNDRVAHGR
ncbi:MAG: hypothetical protein AAGF11_31010 [Myxococcota bacterium]